MTQGPEIWQRRWGRPTLWPPRPDGWLAWRGVRAAVDDESLLPEAEDKLSPAFVEWAMGFPRVWTDVPGVSREERLGMLGNAVVPAVAALAWHELTAALAPTRTIGSLGPGVLLSTGTGRKQANQPGRPKTDTKYEGEAADPVGGDRTRGAFDASLIESRPAAWRGETPAVGTLHRGSSQAN